MKRKLRTWVKVTAAAAWLTGLSVAASCTNGNIPAAAYHPAPKAAVETELKEAHRRTETVTTSAVTEKSDAQKAGEAMLVVPKLLKEVVSI